MYWENIMEGVPANLFSWSRLLPAGAAVMAGCLLAPALLAEPSQTPEYREAERSFWAFQKRSRPEPPRFANPPDQAWVRTPVDAFVLAKLRENGLRPSPEAGRETLIRRLFFDLTGLPPSTAAVADFLSDPSPRAYEELVERLLASPQYGERWAQHWLDVVRFAETEGFEYDRQIQGAWRYRDYVIRSFNADKPYDQFVREQIAGDELSTGKLSAGKLSTADHEPRIAAGFHRLGAVRRNAGNQEVSGSRNEVLTERTDIIGAAFLGLTVGCARCHDHMFDPIRQRDYYQMQAFLAATREEQIILAPEGEQEAWKAKTSDINEKIKKVKQRLKDLEGEEKERVKKEVDKQVRQLEALLPKPLPAIASIRNDAEKRTAIHVLERGNWDKKGRQVGMRALGVLLPDGAPVLPANTPNPRTLLANWLTEPDHPLTARVMVNRVWGFHFGTGIVKTANDFGFNGERPSHPALLDHLANRFVESGWSVKALHRMMVNSSTYRQASRSSGAAAGRVKDPENRLLWRFTRRRLEAEEIRDAMLAVSGRWNPKAGGKSIMVPVEPELIGLMYKPEQWQVAKDPREHERRSIYLIAKRNLRLPFMEVFDQPTLLTSCSRRESSTHAPQALELLNGRLSNGLARAFAKRLRREVGGSPLQQVERAYLLAAGRAPTEKEKWLALEFLRTQPLEEFALAVFNLNAFLYVN